MYNGKAGLLYDIAIKQAEYVAKVFNGDSFDPIKDNPITQKRFGPKTVSDPEGKEGFALLRKGLEAMFNGKFEEPK